MDRFVVGDTVTLRNLFKVSGTLTDPTTVSLAVTSPSGTTTTYTYVLALALMWSVGGAVLGLVLGGVERSWPQAGAGGVAGLLGGLLGAAVGAQLYLAINFETRHVTWTVSRLSEMLEGGALGAGLWCSLSLARRVVLEWRRA